MAAPKREVIKARELIGPNGGVTMVMELSCGHVVWQRRKRPAKELRCVMCWWDEQERADQFDQSDHES